MHNSSDFDTRNATDILPGWPIDFVYDRVQYCTFNWLFLAYQSHACPRLEVWWRSRLDHKLSEDEELSFGPSPRAAERRVARGFLQTIALPQLPSETMRSIAVGAHLLHVLELAKGIEQDLGGVGNGVVAQKLYFYFAGRMYNRLRDFQDVRWFPIFL